MVCPKCDYECTDGQGLTITDPDSSLAGTYCIRCWALHIAAVVPKMVPKDTAKEAVP